MTSGLGKVILLGEHAVVYGHPALAGAIDRRVSCRVTGSSSPGLRLSCLSWGLDVAAGDEHPVAAAIRLIADELGFEANATLRIDTTLPPAAGLGSSAALCVAMTRAMAEAKAAMLSDDELAGIANRGEASFHDNPSGVDVALALSGGIGLYQRERGLERFAAAPFELAVGLTGVTRNTGDMVRSVASHREAEPAATDQILGRLGELSTLGHEALGQGQLPSLGPLFEEAQGLLASLGLSCPETDELIALAKTADASAKLTGAGGGGAVIALGPSPSEIIRVWRQAGYDAFVATVGARP